MDAREKFDDLTALFMMLTSKLHALEHAPQDFGTGLRLYAAEIRAVVAIGEHPEINVTDLARHLGITKGAVSQLISRMEKKDLVKRFRSYNNDKTVLMRLTQKGEQVLGGVGYFHSAIDRDFMKELDRLTPQQRAFLENMVKKILSHVDMHLKQIGKAKMD